MISLFLWYVVMLFLGLATFPLAYHFFPGLTDRGYTFSRILGLLLWGYVYWLLVSLGFLTNSPGGLFFGLAILLFTSGWALKKTTLRVLAAWFSEKRALVVITELLFFAAFAAWAFVRSANPEIYGTEKPMELAFINAILRSPTFPPHDPWLSGYAISYYYFGYVLVSMLAMFTGTTGGVAFNLGVALVFALAAQGAFGVVYNLLERLHGVQEAAGKSIKQGARIAAALWGPVFVLLVSNLGGFLEFIHANGWFWRAGTTGALESRFWSWLNIENLVDAPATPITGEVNRFWWWWRSSRVVEDFSFTGGSQEVIDEFPFFSFLLGDLHPHVLALPFVLMAMGLAIHIYFQSFADASAPKRIRFFGQEYPLTWLDLGLAGVIFGGLAFLNTWDFPIYVAVFAGAFVLRRIQEDGLNWDRLWEFLGLGLFLGFVGVALYLPFYTGFASQAGGILPNVINPTRGVHLWVMFGTLWIPLGLYLYDLYKKHGAKWLVGVELSAGLLAFLAVFSLALAGAILLSPAGVDALEAMGAPDAGAVLSLGLNRRLAGIGGLLTLVLLLTIVLGLILRLVSSREGVFETPGRDEERNDPSRLGGELIPLLFILIGTLLVIAPEFVYLRDLFNSRMNTVFKFYYQAWLLWSIAAAAGTGWLILHTRGPRQVVATSLIGLMIFLGLIYPMLSLPNKTNNFQPSGGLTLDGTQHSVFLNNAEREAVSMLSTLPLGAVAEAVTGSYNSGGRIAVHSGQPAVLGWPFHQQQWRGGVEEMGSREADLQQLYQTTSWETALQVIRMYDIKYVIVGPLERSLYRVSEAKFRENLQVLYEQGDVTLFGLP